MFRRSTDSMVLCRQCLNEDDAFQAAELNPAHFPGTYTFLTCVRCGRTARDVADNQPAPVRYRRVGIKPVTRR